MRGLKRFRRLGSSPYQSAGSRWNSSLYAESAAKLSVMASTGGSGSAREPGKGENPRHHKDDEGFSDG
jgi:hypothetical protein